MGDDKLIEIARKYEFICNLKHPKYSMDNVKKDTAWKEIGGQLKQSAIACKQRLQCLRDAYKRHIKKKIGRNEQAAKTIKPCKYENEMTFIVPFCMDRKTQDTIEITSDDEIHATEITVLEKPNTDIKIEDTPANVNDANRTNLSDEVPKIELQQKKNTKKPKAVKRKAVQSEPPATAKLKAKLFDGQNKLEPTRGHDDIDRFFFNIGDTVKKFSPYLRALAKNKIFSLVSEMELKQFAPPSISPYAFNASPQSASTITTPMPTSADNWNDQTTQSMSTNIDNWIDQTLHYLP